MAVYVLKRLLWFIPTLFVISLLAFAINNNSPGDPVEIYSGAATPEGSSSGTTVSQATKDSIRTRLHLDKPVFYFSVGTAADCDTLYKVKNKKHRKTLHRLTRKYGNWKNISAWYNKINLLAELQAAEDPQKISIELSATGDSTSPPLYPVQVIADSKNNAQNLLISLYETHDETEAKLKLDSLQKIYAVAPYFQKEKNELRQLADLHKKMTSETVTWKNYIPSLHWFGADNQYHFWLEQLVTKGDFGYSYYGGKNISENIWEKFRISFRLIFFSVLIAYLLSIPIGVYSARKKDSWFDRSSSVVLFMLYSLPSFFVGILLLWFFANPDFFVWFPESGYIDPSSFDPNWPFWKRFVHQWPFMILPLITYTYSSLAFISRIMRTSMLESLTQDYIRTARAKGLAEKTVTWKHAFRNSLLPVITMFVNIFPMAIGGSVIVETIFTYPGMGLASFDAIHNYDYPSIVAIFTLAGFLTMLGYLVADILYAIADPRISFTGKMR